MTYRESPVTAGLPSLDVDGTEVHLIGASQALDIIVDAARTPRQPPLAVASINLDHVHHFGRGNTGSRFGVGGTAEWLNLIDGAPLARQAKRVTGVGYQRLSGSDLAFPIMDAASAGGLSVGIVGGLPEVKQLVADQVGSRWPDLRLAGHWTPSRAELGSPEAMQSLAAQIHEVGADILLVCLGKPRQEQWIEAYGEASGAGVLLAFGAVVDFLAGRVARAPEWIARAGLEWAWRLMLEPRRLANRYLVQGPPAYLTVRRSREVRAAASPT